MPPYVRPPDVSAVNPRAQCGGDWTFFYQSALEFLVSAEERVDTQLNKDQARKVAHTIKTGAELLCMVSAALSAFQLEVAAANEADDLELLEHQSVLLEHIMGSKLALLSDAVKANPAAALEAVDGRIDLLRKQPAAPAEFPLPRGSSGGGAPAAGGGSGRHLFAAPSSLRRMSSTGGGGPGRPSSGGADFPSGGALPFPSRVAVISRCPITGKLVAGALSQNQFVPSKTAITCYDSLDDAAADSAPVIVVCTCPELRFSAATTKLPMHAPPLGQRRGFVIMGDVDELTQEAIFMCMSGWCELVRFPLITPELVRRVSSVFMGASGAPSLLAPPPPPPGVG